MNIFYAKRPLLLGNAFLDTVPTEPGVLTPVNNGYIVVLPSGEILSVQPNADFQTRPAGTAGAYEVCQRNAKLNVLTFTPAAPGQVSTTYHVAYRAA